MQTVTFTCEQCGKRMAVLLENQGKQVLCPSCKQVVLAPAAPVPSSPAPPPDPPEESLPILKTPELPIAEAESIFTPASHLSEDLFESEPRSRVEMPPAEPELEPVPPIASEVVGESFPLDEPAISTARKPARRSLVVPILLIFLVPYAIVATGAIAWLLYQQNQLLENQFDPFERLPDPSSGKPDKGSAKRVKHDEKLPAKLRTALDKPIQVGALLVTPVKIEFEPMASELHLTLRMKNVSSDLQFNPISDDLVRYTPPVPPYTFLETKAGNIYGAFLEYGPIPARDGLFNGILQPGEEMNANLSAKLKQKDVQELTGSLLWRVHVRRGLVETWSKKENKKVEVSATAVIGVEFTAREVTRRAAVR